MQSAEDQIISIVQLLALHDRDFVAAAYRAVLGRVPDAEGQAYHLDRIRAGVPKLTLLGQMRRSREGRNFTPTVSGLDAAIRRHRRATIPFFGFFIRLATGAEGQGATHRQLRIIVNEIGRLQPSSMKFDAAASNMMEQVPAATTSRLTSSLPASAASKNFSGAIPFSSGLNSESVAADLDSFERRLLRALWLSSRAKGTRT